MSATSLKQAATGQIQKKEEEKNPVASFEKFLDKYMPQLEKQLPEHLSAKRMARLAISEFAKNPELQQCEAISIVASVMTAAAMGLEIGVAGQGFMVPYNENKKVGNRWETKKKAQFIPGWKGLVDLVNRSGNGTVYTGVIFSDQKYTFVDGAKRDLIIHNETDLEDPEEITHAYAIGWVKGAEMPIIELWRVSKLKKHRDKNNKLLKKESHYSFKHWEAYCRKIPLLRVIDYMPKSIELQKAVDVAQAQEIGKNATIEGEFVAITPINEFAENEGAQIDQETGEISEPAPAQNNDGQLFEGNTAEVVEKRLREAKDIEILDLAADDIRTLPEAEQARLNGVYKELKEKLAK